MSTLYPVTPTTFMSLGRSLHRPPRRLLLTLIVAPVSTARDTLCLPTWQGKAMMLVLAKAAVTDCKLCLLFVDPLCFYLHLDCSPG